MRVKKKHQSLKFWKVQLPDRSTHTTSANPLSTIDTTPIRKQEKQNLTSTPKQLNKKKNNDCSDKDLSQRIPLIVALLPKVIEIKKSENLSGTATRLQEVLGKDDIVEKYDKIRKALKLNKTKYNSELYKDVIAVVEVKLKTSEESLLAETKKIDISKVTGECNDQLALDYQKVIKKLHHIKILKKELLV